MHDCETKNGYNFPAKVPEEVFGPLSLKALENDKLKRNVEGFLPDADVAFLDEAALDLLPCVTCVEA